MIIGAGPSMEEDIEEMTAVIQSLRTEYFIVEEGDEDYLRLLVQLRR
jgi:hypothetical protein